MRIHGTGYGAGFAHISDVPGYHAELPHWCNPARQEVSLHTPSVVVAYRCKPLQWQQVYNLRLPLTCPGRKVFQDGEVFSLFKVHECKAIYQPLLKLEKHFPMQGAIPYWKRLYWQLFLQYASGYSSSRLRWGAMAC